MKILIYQPRASYFTGGGEVYPLQNAKFFAKLGHDVTLLTTKADFLIQSKYFKLFVKDCPKLKIEYLKLDENYKDIYSQPAGIDWTRWDRESLWISRLAYQYISSNKFDIVAIHNVIDTLAVPFNCKHVLHLHGAPSELNYICKLVLEKEKNLIAVSKNVMANWISLGAYPKMKICTNAIDESVFVINPKINKNIDLLFVGRLIPIKGIQFILQALKLLKDNNNFKPNFSIVGDGPYKEELVLMTKELGLEEQVKFCGLLFNNDLVKVYQSAKVTVFPSYEKEGIMSTLLEAASCGIPSITTEGTSMEEFANKNKNALLVKSKDANDLSEKIYQMLTDEKLASSIAKNALYKVRTEFTWLSKAEQLINIYKEVK